MSISPSPSDTAAAIQTLSARYGGHYGVIIQLMRQINPDARQGIVNHIQTNRTIFGFDAMYVDLEDNPRVGGDTT